MVSFCQIPEVGQPRTAVQPLHELARQCQGWETAVAGGFCCGGRAYETPRFRFVGPSAGSEPVRLGFFAGVHGDEPAGCAALAQFAAALVADPARAAGYEFWLDPVVNPTGYEYGARCNRSGKDLNREFWIGSAEPEVCIFERELRTRRFHGVLTLHADDTCEGLYGYSHGRTLDQALLQPALRAAERLLPLDSRAVIDGFVARDGTISDCFRGVLSAPADQNPRPFDVILETPAHAPFALQVAAAVAALDTIIAGYRGFIAYAQDL